MEQNERRRKPPQRTSRAAQAAEQRRIERREQERLANLREKQKKRAKRRTKKRISAAVWKRLLIMGGVVIAIVISMVLFFRVRTIEVTGGKYYTADEVIAASGLSKGDNLLTISRAKTSGNVLAALPYIKSVQVTRHLPDTIELSVTEYEVTYAVKSEAGDFYLVTADGKVAEKVDDQRAAEHIKIEGFTIASPVVGEFFTVSGDQLVAEGQRVAMTALLTQLEASALTKEVASVEIPASYELALWYADQYYVKLGDKENLDYKLEYLKAVLEKLEDYQTGTIDLSFSDGNNAIFTPRE